MSEPPFAAASEMTVIQSACRIVRALLQERSRNVLAMYAYFLLAIAADGLLMGTWWNNFVSRLPGFDTELVGKIQLVGGIAAAVAAVPLGILADRWSKIRMLRIGSAVAAVYAITTGAAILLRLPILFYLSSVLSLVKLAFVTGPQIALIVLSTSPPNRLLILVFITGILQPLAISIGPLAAIIADAEVGQGGNMSEQAEQTIMIVACAVALASAPFLAMGSESACWKDPSSAIASLRQSLKHQQREEGSINGGPQEGEASVERPLSVSGLLLDSASSPHERSSGENEAVELQGGFVDTTCQDAVVPLLKDAAAAADDDAAKHHPHTSSGRQLYAPTRLFGFIPLVPQAIPYLVFVNDFAEGFASGLTDSFFASMLGDHYQLTTMASLGIILASGFTSALFSMACVAVSYPLGRALSVAVADAITLLCMVAFALQPPLWLAVLCYLVISGLSAGTIGVQRGMLVDVVSPNNLSFWNSLENVSAFLSALGTYVAGRNLSPRTGIGKPGGYWLNAQIAVGFNIVSLIMSSVVVPMANDRHLAPRPAH